MFSILLLIPLIGVSQEDKKRHSIIGFYNCENLFDTINDPLTRDDEYLPRSKKHWNTEKYNEKLSHLARVILAMGDWKGPDIVGLCEVEHKSVVQDLISKTYLSKHDYSIVHQESKDKRGIDVALIFKKKAFKLLDYDYINVKFKNPNSRPTRDILYVYGILKSTDTVHIFMNHWPSRFGGAIETKPKREQCADLLRTRVDSIFNLNRNAYILISGDFNDHVDNESISSDVHLGARQGLNKTDSLPYLVNTSYHLKKDLKQGSHKFNGYWSILDQWIVSSHFFAPDAKLRMNLGNSFIFKKDWMLTEDTKSFGKKPFRSYEGDRYIGGYSDHLPVFLKVQITE